MNIIGSYISRKTSGLWCIVLVQSGTKTISNMNRHKKEAVHLTPTPLAPTKVNFLSLTHPEVEGQRKVMTHDIVTLLSLCK